MARLGTPLRDDSLDAELDGGSRQDNPSSSAIPGLSTGSKRDTVSGSVSQPTVSRSPQFNTFVLQSRALVAIQASCWLFTLLDLTCWAV